MASLKDEAELLLKINQGIPPDLQKRYNELITKGQNLTQVLGFVPQPNLQLLVGFQPTSAISRGFEPPAG